MHQVLSLMVLQLPVLLHVLQKLSSQVETCAPQHRVSTPVSEQL